MVLNNLFKLLKRGEDPSFQIFKLNESKFKVVCQGCGKTGEKPLSLNLSDMEKVIKYFEFYEFHDKKLGLTYHLCQFCYEKCIYEKKGNVLEFLEKQRIYRAKKVC